MKQPLIVFSFILLLTCCKNKNKPDVSGIPVAVKIERFDNYLLKQVDTTQVDVTIREMIKKYPTFGPDFLQYFLGISPAALQSNDGAAAQGLANFRTYLRFSKMLYDSIAPQYADMSQQEQELKKAFQ